MIASDLLILFLHLRSGLNLCFVAANLTLDPRLFLLSVDEGLLRRV